MDKQLLAQNMMRVLHFSGGSIVLGDSKLQGGACDLHYAGLWEGFEEVWKPSLSH